MVRFRIGWTLALPLRLYLRQSRLVRGKGFVLRQLLPAMLPPPPSGFELQSGRGEFLKLYYREEVGLSTLLSGDFERAERAALVRFATPGSTAVDVGANIGLLAIPLAGAVGKSGLVLAFEPHPENFARLERNMLTSHTTNMVAYQTALGSRTGSIALNLGSDSAYHSTAEVATHRRTGNRINVRVTTLDKVWRERGLPPVSIVKIDVEGAEVDVLEGSQELIEMCKPIVLAEASSKTKHQMLAAWFSDHGYREKSFPGLRPWNHLFEPSLTT